MQDTQHDSDDSLRSQSTMAGSTAPPWFSRIPELDIVLLGGFFGLSDEEALETKGLELFREIYTARDSLPCNPSVVLDSWLFDRGHYWLAMPSSGRAAPLLLFLHGNGGNFQSYPKILTKLAQEHHVAVAMPTFGWGNWQIAGQERSLEVLEDILERHSTIDRERIFIGGVSAGSIGAIRTMSNHPERFRGVIAISGVPQEEMSVRQFTGKSVLIVHGEDDARIAVDSARALADRLREHRVEVDYFELPGSGHFALLTQQQSILARVVALLNQP